MDVTWDDTETAMRVVCCPACKIKLRLPDKYEARLRCSSCHTIFQVRDANDESWTSLADKSPRIQKTRRDSWQKFALAAREFDCWLQDKGRGRDMLTVLFICVAMLIGAVWFGNSSISWSITSIIASVLIIVYLCQRKCPNCCRRGSITWLHSRKDGGADLRYKYNPLTCYRCGWRSG